MPKSTSKTEASEQSVSDDQRRELFKKMKEDLKIPPTTRPRQDMTTFIKTYGSAKFAL